MIIAVDARELAARPTGVGRYLEQLLDSWETSGAAARHELVLYGPADPLRLPDVWQPRFRRVPGAGGTRWEQWELARALQRDRPDVLFAPGYTAPLGTPAPIVLAIHDVSFFAHPEWFSAREGLRRRRVTAWSARRARLVLAPSAFSGREIVRFTGVPEARVRIVPLGVRQPAGAPAGGHRAPVVLYAGSLFQRRRVDVLIEAFADLAERHPDARLEIVGENRTVPHVDFGALVARHGLNARVTFRHWVDDATLDELYGRASVFVFLSRYEGFGFTPLEAMAGGAVPIVLDTDVAREVYGDAAIRLPDEPGLRHSLAAALGDLLADDRRRARYLAAALGVLARYRWADAAARTMAAIEEAAGG